MPKITALPSRKDNYIWLIECPPERKAVVVDPGEAAPVERALAERKLELAAILVTHHHYDHVEGIPDLVAEHPIPVFGPADEPVPCRTHPVEEGEHLPFAEWDIDLSVMKIPGHTKGHVGYYGGHRLFCGDTLFTAGCGKVFDGTVEQLFLSLQRIAALPGNTLIHCAHEYTEENLRFARLVEPGNPDIHARLEATHRLRAKGVATVPSMLTEEKRTNPFLRCHVPEVIRAAEQYAGHPLKTSREVFEVLRDWRDRFG